MRRLYRVIAQHDCGLYAWDSLCEGFGLFDRVQSGTIEQWEKFATEKSGRKCAVINFMRIKPSAKKK